MEFFGKQIPLENSYGIPIETMVGFVDVVGFPI